jgi:predicted RNA methylase
MPYSIITLFRSCYGQSRLWEFQSVATREYPHVDINWIWEETCYRYYGGDYGPSIIQRLSADLTVEQWVNIGVQCVGFKAVFQVVGEGKTITDCVADVGRLTDHEILKLVPDTWSIKIKHLGRMKGLSPSQRRAQVEQFSEVLGVLTQRRVDLETPDTELCLLKDCRRLEECDSSTNQQKTHYHWLLKRINSNTNISAHELAIQSDVKKRAFIGTTTMPSNRALLMANLAQVTKGDVILDPFCGSAGLLLASSLLGVKAVGGDLDVAMLSHKDKPLSCPPSSGRPQRGVEKVSYGDSFIELGLPEPTLLIGADIQDPNVVEMYLAVNHGQPYDAIVTDPPYGIRESQSNMMAFELLARVCEVAEGVLKNEGHLVLLQVIEGTLKHVDLIQKELLLNIEKTLSPYHVRMYAMSLERFNAQHLRATIVLVKHDIVV